ncbi:hypothetical protein THARTR1_08213 [Trichoderma harzianum]|uniref:Uncharacterized protein n=1 Tax=Trichoderma harzianum TaxID=5544 RepID=A0A2K0U064_TRIHA|nr:hypothetical protein THARTR1_08213 [Trichoderma harzianum]
MRIVSYISSASFPTSSAVEQAAKRGRSSPGRVPLAPRLVAYPIDEKLPVRQLPRIHHPGADARLAGREAQQRRHRGDCVQRSQRRARDGGRHHLGGIELDGGEEHAAVGLADAGGDEAAEERLDGAAGRTPRGCPEGEERRLEGGGEGEDGVERGWRADAISQC